MPAKSLRLGPLAVPDEFSASLPFLEWIRESVRRLRGLSGHLTVRPYVGHPDLACLKYAKRESVSLLKWIYYAPDIPARARKREKAARALAGGRWYRHDVSGTI
jgi:hypothetical protein